jgi:Tfp pilus assembly protein PilN
MIEINLLPKELQWKRFRITFDRTFLIILGTGAVILAALAVYSYVFQLSMISSYAAKVRNAEEEVARFSAEIQKIDDIQLKKQQIIDRMTAIQILDQNRSYWVNLLEDLVRRVPDYVWLTSIQQSPPAAPKAPATQAAGAAPSPPPAAANSSIEGYSFSLNALATFLIRLKKSERFSNIEISSITLQENDKAKAYLFKLTCNLDVPGQPRPMTATEQPPGTSGTQF